MVLTNNTKHYPMLERIKPIIKVRGKQPRNNSFFNEFHDYFPQFHIIFPCIA